MQALENVHREARIEKVTLNIGVGEGGDRLQKAVTLLNALTGQSVYTTRAHTRTTFGTPKGRPIGAKVTLRGEKAEEFLRLALRARGNTLPERSFDARGNVSFGIEEHIDIPGVRYDPKIGIFGMDVCVTLERPGYRVKRRRLATKVGAGHLLTKEEGIEFIKRKFGVEVV